MLALALTAAVFFVANPGVVGLRRDREAQSLEVQGFDSMSRLQQIVPGRRRMKAIDGEKRRRAGPIVREQLEPAAVDPRRRKQREM